MRPILNRARKKYFEKSTINIVVVWNKPKTKKHDAGDGNLFVLFHIIINLRGTVAKYHTVPKIDDF